MAHRPFAIRTLNLEKCSCCESACRVADYLEHTLGLARAYQKRDCVLMQEWILRHACHTLLEVIIDPINPFLHRQQCLDQLYKPLLALKRFYTCSNNLPKFWRFSQQLNQQCQHLFPEY
jgi:hypothetical protein